MICPKCGANQSTCKESRQRGTARWRRYKCNACKTIYETTERVLIAHDQKTEGARQNG